VTRVLVSGATGNIGVELVHLLSGDPAVTELRAATRDPDEPKAQLLAAMRPEVVKPVRFSTDATDLEQAFDSIDVLCLITPLGPEAADWQRKVLAAANGVRRIVKVSVDAAGPEATAGPGAVHWAGEETIRAMKVEVAIVRPTIFMQHFLIVPGLHARGEDRIYLPIGNAAMTMLDCRDISAAVAALAVADVETLPPLPVHMTGPDALTGPRIADLLSLAAGRPIAWVSDKAAFVAHSDAMGSPAELAKVYEAGASGAFAQVDTQGFKAITDRLPSSFAKFVFDNAERFRQPAVNPAQ
jgi:uncharacterized protein YbjT (DUF2867 family)